MSFRQIINTIVFTTIIFASVNTVQAQSRNINSMDRLVRSYIDNLEKKNNGIVESSIFNLMRLRQNHQEGDFRKAQNVLGSLSLNGESAEIRYMAYLANSYLEDPQRLPWFTDLITELESLEDKLDSFQVFRTQIVRHLFDLGRTAVRENSITDT